MSFDRFLKGFAVLPLLLTVPFACTSAPANQCVAGQAIACAGDTGCAGHQTCNAMGAYDKCVCNSGAGGTTASSTTTSSVGVTTASSTTTTASGTTTSTASGTSSS